LIDHFDSFFFTDPDEVQFVLYGDHWPQIRPLRIQTKRRKREPVWVAPTEHNTAG
jgi:hypothetical protein